MLDDVEFKFKVGDFVHSERCGTRAPFYGRVVQAFLSGTNKRIYIVDDGSNGHPWSREETELTLTQ